MPWSRRAGRICYPLFSNTKPQTDEARGWWEQWLTTAEDDVEPQKLQDYDAVLTGFVARLTPENRLTVVAGLAPEERLAGLAPEERLAGLAPEERLAGLAPEERLAGL